MNFVKYYACVAHILKAPAAPGLLVAGLLSVCLIGCGEQISLPSTEQLAEFQNAGPVLPKVDVDHLVRARTSQGSYRVVVDDVLELQIPAILQEVNPEQVGSTEISRPHICRVYDDGTITVPVIGHIQALGKTLSRIEIAVINAYYPKYTTIRPSVFAKVAQYKTARVSITGAVEEPGIYELRTNQMSLVSLIMAAGGIIDDGAGLIRITHNDRPDPAAWQEAQANEDTKNLLDIIDGDSIAQATGMTDSASSVNYMETVLPIKGLNIPFADLALKNGDNVEVERLERPLFTVMGLVRDPGNFPYPPETEYNLIQALGFAGGFNQAAEPRYATVYRQKADRSIVSATFNIVNGSSLTGASNILIKPGDIVAVEHTQRTRTKIFLERAFRINFGIFLRPESLLGSDD